MSRVVNSHSKLDAFVHLMGKVPDEEIAVQAGVSTSAVARERRRLSIKPDPSFRPVGARPVDESTPSDTDAPPAEGGVARGRSKLTALAHLIGVETDRTVATMAGVSIEAVRMYRKRRGIASGAAAAARAASAAVDAEARVLEADGAGEREGDAAEAGGAAPETGARTGRGAAARRAADKPGRRRSRLDPYIGLVGKVPDAEVAAKAGVTTENVRAFRNRHGIAAYYRQPDGDGALPMPPRRGRPPKPRPVDGAPGAGLSAAPRAGQAAGREAWSVRSSSGVVYVVVASGFAAAAAEAAAQLAAVEPKSSVVGIERVGVSLA